MRTRGRPRHPDILTPRQWEVLALLRRGLTNEEIAQELDITQDGVKFHVSDILRRLGVESRHEAALWQPASAPPRRWIALAPIAGLLHVKPHALAYGFCGAMMASVAVAVGLLVWGITSNGEGQSGVADRPSAHFVAATGVPQDLGNASLYSFDPTTGALEKLPAPALEPSALSPDGQTIAGYLGGQLLITARSGSQHTIDRTAAGAEPTDWSDDGQRMLVVGSEGLTTIDAGTSAVMKLMTGNIQTAIWSPDERHVAFVQDQQLGIFDVDLGVRRLIAPGHTAMYLPNFYGRGYLAWSPDGQTIAFGDWTPEEPTTQGRSDIYVVGIDGRGLRRLTNSPRGKLYYAFSPNGQYLAYVNNDDNGDKLRIVEVASGSEQPIRNGAAQTFPPPWIDHGAVLVSDYTGVSLVHVDGSAQLLIAAADLPGYRCYRSLVGWGAGRIVFYNSCFGGN